MIATSSTTAARIRRYSHRERGQSSSQSTSTQPTQGSGPDRPVPEFQVCRQQRGSLAHPRAPYSRTLPGWPSSASGEWSNGNVYRS